MAILSEDLLDKELKAVLKAGGYRSEKAVISHALEVLLAANPSLRLAAAVELYRSGEVTLERAAEIGGVDFETFKDHLNEKGIDRTVDTSREDILSGEKKIADYIKRRY